MPRNSKTRARQKKKQVVLISVYEACTGIVAGGESFSRRLSVGGQTGYISVIIGGLCDERGTSRNDFIT